MSSRFTAFVRRQCLTIATALVLLPSHQAAQAQMSIAGSFAVSPSGAATYTIPIQVPPGVAGMEPKLALTYSSQAGNGYLGTGWSLSGLSTITRCSRTINQDDVRGRVNFDLNDRYCLDGLRMFAIKGSDGSDGAEYRAEQEGYSQIMSYAEAGATNGPGSFIIKTKSGLTMEYGKTADSRIELPGKTVVRAWVLNKVTDARGNSYNIIYVEDSVNGQYYPLSIAYGSPVAPVVLSFQSTDRVDAMSGYVGGVLSRQTKLLSGLLVTVGGANVSGYEFLYSQNPLNRQSVMDRVRHQYKGIYEPDLKLNRANEVSTAVVQLARYETKQGNYLASNSQWFPMDANGDGLTDLVYVFSDGGYITIDAHVNTGSGFALQRWETRSGNYATVNANWFVADANGDGLSDLVYVLNDGGYITTDVHVNTGAGFVLQRWETRSGNYLTSNAQFFVFDATGDGLPDLIYVFSDGGFISTDVHVNTGSGFLLQRWETRAGNYVTVNANWFVADANGDGLQDLVYVLNDGGYITTDVHVNTGSGFILQRWETRSGNYLTSNAQFFVFDANGDGLPDLIYVFSDGGFISTDVHVNTGSGFLLQRWETRAGNYVTVNANWFVADANGDGLQDLVYVLNDGGYITTDVHVNTGSGFSLQRWETRSGTYLTSNAMWFNDDVTGDGVPDLIYVFNDSGYISIDAHKFPHQNSLVTGFGVDGQKGTLVQYARGASGYLKTRTSSYPNTVLTPPFWLVSAYTAPDGVGADRRVTLSYGNFLVQSGQKGLGSLGFQWMQTKDEATSLINRTCYRQDHPYIGMVSQSIQGTSDANWPACGSFKGGATGVATPNVLSLTTNTYATKVYSGASTKAADCGDSCTISPGQRYFVYPSQTVTQSWDWDSGTTFIALPQSRTSTTYDDWGNAVTIKAETLNPDGTVTGYAKTTTNNYAPANTSNWILGRVTKTTVESAAP